MQSIAIQNATTGKVISMKDFVQCITQFVEGQEWPADAEFKLVYKNKTWPRGWDEGFTRYFTSQVELDLFLLDKWRWTMEEDNGFIGHIYKWDLGPEFVRTIQY